MSAQKIFYPSEKMQIFYFYYSYLILILCWLIAPLQFYVILTQSKRLNNFKWLVLNHSIWCLAFETLYSITKPVFLFPAIAGFPLGAPRNGSNKTTTILFLFGFFSIVNMCQSLSATILNRYLLTFPSKLSKWFTFKKGATLIIFSICLNYVAPLIMIYSVIKKERNEILEFALKQNPSLKIFFNETAFSALPYSTARTGYFFSLIVLLIFFFGAFYIIGLFIYHIRSHNTLIFAKLQLTLIISVIVELAVFNIFLIFPCICFVVFICFQIPNTVDISCLLFCLVLTHSFLQCLITMYFISPYRKYISQLFFNFFNSKVKPKPLFAIISVSTPKNVFNK